MGIVRKTNRQITNSELVVINNNNKNVNLNTKLKKMYLFHSKF